MTTVRIPDRLHHEVTVRASTLNEEARTVEIIWAAGAAVKRYDWREGGYYIEELSMEPGAVRMERFAAGMSLLDSHSSYSMSDRLGTVVPGSVKISGGKGFATVKFSRSEAAETIFRDLIDGHPFPVSVGYRTHAYEKTEGDENALPVLRAIDWEPFELSAVPIPADPAAHSLRSETAGLTDVAVREPQERTAPMSRTQNVPDELHEVPETRAAPRQPAPATPRFGMRERRALIDQVGARLDEQTRADLLEDHRRSTDMEIRAAVLDAIVERQEAAGIFPHTNRARGDGVDFVRAAGEAMSAAGNSSVQLSESARQYRGMGFSDLARMCLERSGERVDGQSRQQIVTRALHASSDFGAALGHSFNVAVARGYAASADELRQAASRKTAPDFKDNRLVDFQTDGDLLKVNEHGEFKRGSYREMEESYRVETFGRIIGVTRQALINDSLDLISATPEALGRKARLFEQTALAAVLLVAGKLADGLPIFDAQFGNLIAEPLTLDSLSAARTVLRSTKDRGGQFIGLRPAYIVVGPKLETTAERLVAQVTAATTADVNVFSGRLQVLVVPQIDDLSWFVAASPAEVDSLIYATLNGFEEPQVESRVGFDVDGIEWRVRHDFGAAWVSRLGWVRGQPA